jgi:hypothetical protein
MSEEPIEERIEPDRKGAKFRFAPWVVFALAAVVWIIFIALTSPDFGGTDAFIFRDAGCNCAAGHGLVSDSVPTDATLIPPRIFAAYTPGAPLLFAPAAKVFGCSPYSDTYYNFFLLVLISTFTLWLYFGFEERPGWRVGASILAGVTLPCGLFLADLDRPEGVALAVALPMLLLWRRCKGAVTKSLLLGCCGLLFLIHPYIGIVEFLLFLFLLLWAPDQNSRLKIAAVGFLLTLGTVAACALSLHHLDPTVIHRFLGHALGTGTGAGAILKGESAAVAHTGILHKYAAAGSRYFSKASILRSTPLLALLGGFASILILLLFSRRRGKDGGIFLQLACLFCILFLFPAALFLPQRNYFAASSALLFAIITTGGYSLAQRLKGTGAPAYLLLIVALFSLPEFSLHLIASVESRTSYLRASQQAVRVKQIFVAQGKPQPRLLIDSAHFFIYKPYFRYLYNSSYLQPEDTTAEFQGLVHCYTGQLAFTRSELKWQPPLDENDWKLIDGGEDVERISLFGHPIQRRNWTWSCDVYERKDAKP